MGTSKRPAPPKCLRSRSSAGISGFLEQQVEAIGGVLGLLVDREMTERDNRRMSSRLRRAKLRHAAILEDIDYRNSRGLDKGLVQSLASCQWVKEHLNVLITGPTGSGKTTTLYAMLQEANTEEVKIITTEDPVEYEIEGIVQVPVNPDIGVTYAAVLRSILRQDPDKILVGEIRDEETASVAVEASLTGHTVFSTIHTNDAPSTITRLVDMGIQPFLISATLEAVVAQRLVRRICPSCREPYQPDEDLLRELGPDGAQFEGATLYFGKGCEDCHHTGYRGRMGIFEVLRVDASIKHSILSGSSSNELRDAARSSGMRSLRDSGLGAVLEGITTIEEVLRETIV